MDIKKKCFYINNNMRAISILNSKQFVQNDYKPLATTIITS